MPSPSHVIKRLLFISVITFILDFFGEKINVERYFESPNACNALLTFIVGVKATRFANKDFGNCYS